MKLRTRLVISFLIMIMLPTMLTALFTWGIAQYQIGVIEHNYGITGTQYKTFSHSLEVLRQMPEVKEFMMHTCIAIVMILALTAMIMIFWIYGGVISPINQLQKAA